MKLPRFWGALGFGALLIICGHFRGPLGCEARAQPRFDPKKYERYFDVNVANPAEFHSGLTTSNTQISLTVIIGRETPDAIAVLVGTPRPPLESPSIKWLRYTNWLRVDLGDTDGDRSIYVAARWKGARYSYHGTGFDVTLLRARPKIWITRPETLVTSRSPVQIQGRAGKHIVQCSYDHLDQAGQMLAQNEDGLAGSNYPGGDPQAAFTLFDVALSLGTNQFVLRCTDEGGNTTTTNFFVVYSTAGDKQPPRFQMVQFPQPGGSVAGDKFTARGHVDDPSATLTGWISGGGVTNRLTGLIERDGFFWYEDLPLALGTNQLTLIATDSAGNSSFTNFPVVGVSGPLVKLDEIVPAQKLWDARITVTGTLAPPHHRLWVNGVAAVVKPDGKWIAQDVPNYSPDGGGVAAFDMITQPLDAAAATSASPQGKLVTNARLGTMPLTLNSKHPACGVFELHVADTAGQPFVLLTSTNLTDWTPILTNQAPGATFDYTDTNIVTNACRFFQLRPLK